MEEEEDEKEKNCNFNFNFGPWVFLSFHQKNTDVSHESNMADAMSLNTCHIMVYFADRSNEGLKYMGLNFTGANWVEFFFIGTKIQIGEFYKDQKYH
jgi:hypothetical protein